MPRPTDRWVDVGVFGRAHGVHGELYAHLHNPASELLTEGRRLRVGEGSEATDLTVTKARRVPRGWLVEVEGIGRREAAAALTNRKLYVPRTALPALADDEVYQEDLVGLRAVTSDGAELGVIVGFFDNGAHDVCVLRTVAGVEVLVPFHEEALVDFRLEADEVVLDVPEGLPGLDDEDSEAPTPSVEQ